MHNLDDRGPPSSFSSPAYWQISAHLPRGLIPHLITNVVAEILSDVELVRCVPGDCRRYLHRAVVLVADSRPPNGDIAEDRLEGEGACSSTLDAGAAFAVTELQDQFLVGLLHEDLEEPALDFKTSLMNGRFNLVGKMLVLVRHGQGHPQRQFERDCLTVTIDGAEGDGSLKAVSGTHGVSPYWNYGGPSCVLFYQLG